MCGSQAVWLRLHTLSFATIRHHLHGPVFSPISGIPPTCFFFSPLLHRFLQFRLFRCRTRSDLLDSLLLTLFRFLRILAPRQLPWILLTRTKFVKLFSFFFFSFPPASYTNSVSTNLLHSHPIFSTRVLRHLFPDFGFYFDPLISIFPVTAGVMYRKLRNAVKKNITSALSSSIPL